MSPLNTSRSGRIYRGCWCALLLSLPWSIVPGLSCRCVASGSALCMGCSVIERKLPSEEVICYWALIPSMGHEKNLELSIFEFSTSTNAWCQNNNTASALSKDSESSGVNDQNCETGERSLCPNMHYLSEENSRLRTAWPKRGYWLRWSSFVHAAEQFSSTLFADNCFARPVKVSLIIHSG